MATAGDVAQVEQAVLAFYSHPTPENDEWLRMFQQQPQSWPLAIALLNSTHHSVRAFAATTLKQRAKKDTRHLQPQDREVRLIELLTLLPNGGSAQVRAQIGVAIATTCSRSGAPAALVRIPAFHELALSLQLELLTFLAQECMDQHNSAAGIAANKTDLQPLIPHVAAAVRGALGDRDCEAWALQCVGAWGSVGLTLEQLQSLGLLSVLGAALSNTSSDAFGTLTHALSVVSSATGHITPDLFDSIVTYILELRAPFTAALEEEDEDRCMEIAELLVAIGKISAPVLGSGRAGSTELVQFAILCTSRGSFACAELCLEMWEALLCLPRASVKDEMGLSLWDMVTRSILARAAYSSASNQTGDDEDMEEARMRYRSAASDLLVEIGAWLGFEVFLRILCSLLETRDWTYIEVVMFATKSLAPELLPETQVMDTGQITALGVSINQLLCMEFIVAFESNTPELLLQSTLRACASFAPWLPLGYPTGYMTALQLSLASLMSNALYKEGGRALAALSAAGAEQLAATDISEQLINGVKETLYAGRSCEEISAAAVKLALKSTDTNRCDIRIASLLSVILEGVRLGGEPTIVSLKAAAAAFDAMEHNNRLNMENVVLSCTAIASLLPQLLPAFQDKEPLLEATSDALSACIRVAGDSYTATLPPFLSHLAEVVAAVPCAPLLRVCQVAFHIHADKTVLHSNFTAFLDRSTPAIIMHLHTDMDTDMIGTYFTLLGNVVTRPSCTDILENAATVDQIIALAVECLLRVWHQTTFRRVMSFLTSFILVNEERCPRLYSLVAIHARAITHAIVNGLGESARPKGTVNNLAPPLHALLQGVGAKDVAGWVVEANPTQAGIQFAENIRGGRSLVQVAHACSEYHELCMEAER